MYEMLLPFLQSYVCTHMDSNTITHWKQHRLLISCAQDGDIGELLSCGAHTTDNTSRPHLTSSRRAGLTRVISGGCASRLWHSCGWQAQPSTQAPVTNIPDSVCLSAPSLISPHLSRTSPPPPTTTLRTLFRPSRHHHCPHTRPSTPTANHHLLNHHTRSGGRARPAPFSLTPPDRHRPSTLTAHQQ